VLPRVKIVAKNVVKSAAKNAVKSAAKNAVKSAVKSTAYAPVPFANIRNMGKRRRFPRYGKLKYDPRSPKGIQLTGYSRLNCLRT
jgi:hypothetical protein